MIVNSKKIYELQIFFTYVKIFEKLQIKLKYCALIILPHNMNNRKNNYLLYLKVKLINLGSADTAFPF